MNHKKVSKNTKRYFESHSFRVAFLIKLINNIIFIFIFNEYSKIMPGLDVILKKKIYNAETDAVNGVVVFDNSSNKIFVGGDCFSSDVNDVLTDTATVTNHIAEFQARTFQGGNVIRVNGTNSSDTFTFQS